MTALRILNLVFLALYVLSVVVQYNDPDPVRWVLMYGAAAVACIWAQSPRMPRWYPALVGAAALGWLILLIPRVAGQVDFGDMFREVGMATMAIEEGREAIGLALVLIWMVVLVRAGRRIPRSPGPGQADL